MESNYWEPNCNRRIKSLCCQEWFTIGTNHMEMWYGIKSNCIIQANIDPSQIAFLLICSSGQSCWSWHPRLRQKSFLYCYQNSKRPNCRGSSLESRPLLIKPPVAAPCGAVWPSWWMENNFRPYRSRTCVKAVWPVCGNSKAVAQRATVWRRGTAQSVSCAIYGRVNNIEPLATRNGGRKEKQDKGVASCAAPPVHTGPQCGPGKRLQQFLSEYQHNIKNFVPSVNDVIF